MAEHDYDIGIIGGGAAGLTVAAGAAQLGVKTMLVEREPKLGGDCLHYGCVPSKTLIESANVYHRMRRASAYGLPEIDLPPVDFSRIAERIKRVVDHIQHHDSVERFCGLGAKIEFGQARFRDEHSIELNGKTVSAARWVIATGSSPAIPDVDGLAEAGFLTNKDIFSLPELPKSIVIFGAGPIAVEMAQAFCRLGSRVQVVQRSAQILSKEDKDMADVVMSALEEEGVLFHLNATVKLVRKNGSSKDVVIEQDGAEKIISGSDILVAMGRSVNVDGMDLENTGVEFDSRQIAVNARMRTNQSHIYAAGDVTGANMFTHAAGYEGGIVVSNAVFRLPRKADYTWLPWCTYCEPELASIGMNEKAAEKAGIDYSVWTENFEDNDRSQAEGNDKGKIKMLLNRKERPIGVQICGPHAGELVNEWVAALNGNVGLSAMAGAIHPYPTLGEINKRVAGRVLSGKIFSDTVKKGLHLLFQYKGRACELPNED